MSFIWDAIAGCSLPGMTIVTAVLFFFAHLFADVVTLILAMLNWFLSITILNVGGVHQALADLFGATPTGAITGLYASMAVLGLAIATAALIWGVLRNQEAMLLGNRWEGARALIGRAGGAVVWIVATPLALYVLVWVNDQLVGAMNRAMATTTWHTNACTLSGALGGGIEGLGTSVIGTALTILFYQVIGLALIAGILAALGQYFLRLFQIVFWGALLPVAAGTSVADPQRRAWTYVWGQVTGSIFTQAAMALGIFLTETVMLAPQAGGTAVMAKFLGYAMGAAGFFVVSRIPRYFQELQGHTVGGGSEMAAIAGGYVMGRFGSQALSATAGGQIAGQAFAATRERTTQRLNQGTGLAARAFQRARSNAYTAQGRNAIDDAGAQVAAGAVADRVAATGITDQGTLDALAAMPASRDASAAVRSLGGTPTIPMNARATPGMGGVLPKPGGDPGSPGGGPPPTGGGLSDSGQRPPEAPTRWDPGDPPPEDPAGIDRWDAGTLARNLPPTRSDRPAGGVTPEAGPPPDTGWDGDTIGRAGGMPGVRRAVDTPSASGTPPTGVGVRAASSGAPPAGDADASGPPIRSGALETSRVPIYGPGSSSAVGASGPAFAAAMAPLAQNYLHSQLLTDSRARANLGTLGVRVTPSTHDTWVQNPEEAPTSARAFHPRVLDRVKRLHEFDQQLAAKPDEAIAHLFGVQSEDLTRPEVQAHIEAELHRVQGVRPPVGRRSFVKPVTLDPRGDYST